MLEVFIPVDARFTLYAQGRKTAMAHIPGTGTYLRFQGTVTLFYTWARYRGGHRRAYIIQEARELRHHRALRLAQVNGTVGVIYRARGRGFDYIKRALFYLLEEYGEEVFLWPALFWQRLSCLIDGAVLEGSGIKRSAALALGRMYSSCIHDIRRGYDKGKQRDTGVFGYRA